MTTPASEAKGTRALADDWLEREPGASDFAAIYLRHFDELSEAVEARLRERPEPSGSQRAQDEEQQRASRRQAREQLERAFEGDWGGYAAWLRRDGEAYANRGLSFLEWYDLATIRSKLLVPLMVEAMAAEPARLAMALVAKQAFFDAKMAVMSESYQTTSQAQLRRWEALFQGIPWGICVTENLGSEIVLINEAFGSIYGRESSSMRGRPFDDLYAPNELERAQRGYYELARKSGQISFESVHVRADGGRVPVMVDAARIPGLGAVESWVFSVHDLTERKQIEALSARSAVLETENRRMQEASRLKSEFLANMSHELRTPLNSILGFSGLLCNGEVGPLSERQLDFITDIHTSGKHLLRLINDVLDLSKVEAGKMEFFPEAVQLPALVGEVLAGVRGVAREKELSFEFASEGVEVVHLDPGRLKQVLYNFLSNAIKFSPRGGVIEVRALLDGPSSFRLQVADHGVGISAENQRRLFQQFEQLDPSRTKAHGGTGLGLALTRRLVEAQGGAVGVASAVGVGSVFHAVLPLRSPTRSMLPQPRRIAGSQASASRVLLVDDEADGIEPLVGALVKAGYGVDTASTGAQALQAADERTYSAVVLDLTLPDAEASVILGALRARRPEAPLVALAPPGSGEAPGAAATLPMPCDAARLVELLGQLAPQAPVWGSVLVIDDDLPSARLVAASIERLGLEVRMASDGQQALEQMQRERPSAIVLDLVMPNLDGAGFMQRFRGEPSWAGIPIFVWTVKDLSSAESKRLLRGVAEVIPKDGSGARRLVDRLRACLRGEAGEGAA